MTSHKCDVLAFGAHPDDVELIVGGTLLVARDSGLNAVVCHLTGGEMGTRGSRDQRREEAEAAAKLLGVSAMEILGLPDGRLAVESEGIEAVVGAIRRYRPRLVLAPYIQDLHPDHEAAGQIVRKASFLSGLEKWEGDGDPWRPEGVLHYMAHTTVQPTLIVDITGQMEEKECAARSYASQFHDSGSTEPETYISGPNFWIWWRSRASYWGHFIGVEYGEPFWSERPLPFRSPFDLFSGFGKYRNK